MLPPSPRRRLSRWAGAPSPGQPARTKRGTRRAGGCPTKAPPSASVRVARGERKQYNAGQHGSPAPADVPPPLKPHAQGWALFTERLHRRGDRPHLVILQVKIQRG